MNRGFLREQVFSVLLFDPGVHPENVLNEAIEEFVNVFPRLHGAFPNAKGIYSMRDRLELRGQPIQGLGGLGVQV